MRFFKSLLGNPLDASIPVFPLSYFLTKSHVTLTDFKLYMSLMMNLDLLILLALFGVTDLYRHAHVVLALRSRLLAWWVRTSLRTPTLAP